jgi:hypothetical protein
MTALAACVPPRLQVEPGDSAPDSTVSDATISPDGASGDGGCTLPSDCDAGQACNPATGVCGTTCNIEAGLTCNGGCCTGTLCVAGNMMNACGGGGAACATCAADTPTCANGDCRGSCGSTVCAAGSCCTGDGGCAAASSSACGSGTACVNCAGSTTGSVCLDGGSCGCQTSDDCPATATSAACNPQTHTCGPLCVVNGTQLACNGGCCLVDTASPSTSYCQPGGYFDGCGHDGGSCVVCASSGDSSDGLCTPGPKCVSGGVCGCKGAPDGNGECRMACGVSNATCMLNTSPSTPCGADAGPCHCVP